LDPVTHTLAALTAAEILAPSPFEPWAAAAAVGAALAPDADFVARRFGHVGLLKFHHTLTHSLVGVAALAAAWAGVLSLVSRLPWLWLAGFAFAGAATHVGLDLILHNNGLMLWWPLSRRMVRGGLVIGLNPQTSSARCGERRLGVCLVCQGHSLLFNRVFFLLLATVAVAAAAWPYRRPVCAVGAAALLAYVGFAAWRKGRARRLAAAALGPDARVFPASFGSGRWLAVAPRDGGFATAAVDLGRRTVAPAAAHAPAPAALAASTAGRDAVAAFRANAIFPFAELGPGGRELWWRDLSYAFTPAVQLHTLKISFDDAGRVAGEEFRERW